MTAKRKTPKKKQQLDNLKKGSSTHRSESAKQVARIVIDNIRKGKKINKGEILKQVGYSNAIQKSPSKVFNTLTYKEETKDVVQELVVVRDLCIAEIKRRITNKKILEMEGIAEIRNIVKDFSTQAQLLAGAPTSRPEVSLPEETKKLLDGIMYKNKK